MAFEGGVEIITTVIAWRGKVVFLNFMLTLLQCCVVIVMQIKLTVVVREQRLSNLWFHFRVDLSRTGLSVMGYKVEVCISRSAA